MAILAGLVMLCATSRADDAPAWQHVFQERLTVFGAKNWIVIADAAYPAQSSDGVEIIKAEGSQIEIVKEVLEALTDTKLLAADVTTTSELASIPEQDAQGITTYRAGLTQLLAGRDVKTLPQDQAIAKTDVASQTRRVLVIKTTSPLPYSAVFLQLTSANWSPEAEKRLRDSMPAGK
jgi:L-fucose mutarotase/ribose pyranase (RbsD/FucU family)